MSDDYDDDSFGMQIGSLHAVNDFKVDKKIRKRNKKEARARMGFHPPEKSWIKPGQE